MFSKIVCQVVCTFPIYMQFGFVSTTCINIAIIDKKELISFTIFFKSVVSTNNIFFFIYITSNSNTRKVQFYFTFGVNLFYCRYYLTNPTHGVHIFGYVIRSRMDNNDIWFLTNSWLNIIYDVGCCSTWVCFYLYFIILKNTLPLLVDIYFICFLEISLRFNACYFSTCNN